MAGLTHIGVDTFGKVNQLGIVLGLTELDREGALKVRVLNGSYKGKVQNVAAKDIDPVTKEELAEAKRIAAAEFNWKPTPRPQWQGDEEELFATLDREDAGMKATEYRGNIYVETQVYSNNPLGVPPLVPDLKVIKVLTDSVRDENGRPVNGEYVTRARWVLVTK